MLLAIDVGNSNIVLGVFDGNQLVFSWRLTSLNDRTADELWVLMSRLLSGERLAFEEIDGVIVSSVVPTLTRTVKEMVSQKLGHDPLIVDHINAGIPIRYENPSDVGPDRLVNSVAAYDLYATSSRRSLIIVDFGTATTFDAVSVEGHYLGGVICPGIEISSDALFQRAARLPRVDVRKPHDVIGRTTEASIQSGLFFGYVSMVEGLVERIRDALGASNPVVCVATGGLANVISDETKVIDYVDSDLTLTGLRLVWQRNC